MNCKIVEVSPSAPTTPRTWTAEELKNGTAPEGLYAIRDGRELEKAIEAFDYGPFTHVGTVEMTLHLDRSKAVR